MAKSKSYQPSLVHFLGLVRLVWRGWNMTKGLVESKVEVKKVHHICICGNPAYEEFCHQCGAVNVVLPKVEKKGEVK
jgi:hypothetical protein